MTATAASKHPLRTLRESHGLTLSDVGSRIGVTQGAVWHWEQGKSIDVTNAIRLARLYGVSVEDLFAYMMEDQ